MISPLTSLQHWIAPPSSALLTSQVTTLHCQFSHMLLSYCYICNCLPYFLYYFMSILCYGVLSYLNILILVVYVFSICMSSNVNEASFSPTMFLTCITCLILHFPPRLTWALTVFNCYCLTPVSPYNWKSTQRVQISTPSHFWKS